MNIVLNSIETGTSIINIFKLIYLDYKYRAFNFSIEKKLIIF